MPKNGLNVSLNSYDDIFSTENIQYCGVHHEADRPDGSERWTDSTPAVSVKITGR